MARTIDQLYALSIPAIQEVFLEVMRGLVDEAMINEMVFAIEAGDVDALFRASGFTPAVLGPILDVVDGIFKEAADITVADWPKRIITPSGTVTFHFNMRNERTEQELRRWSSEWVTRITDEARENVRVALEQGMIHGDNPRRIALDIAGRVNPTTKQREGGVVGLAHNQVKWANSARDYLEQLDERYFEMTLRDKRFDSIVRKAIESGKPLNQETISKLLTAYKNNALRFRGENVSRTETIQAINRGEYAAHTQAINEGVLSKERITKEWDDVGDGRTRTTHRILGETYGKGKGIAFDQPFVTVGGSRLMYPGDSSLGAPGTEIIACRCKQRIRVRWRDG